MARFKQAQEAADLATSGLADCGRGLPLQKPWNRCPQVVSASASLFRSFYAEEPLALAYTTRAIHHIVPRCKHSGRLAGSSLHHLLCSPRCRQPSFRGRLPRCPCTACCHLPCRRGRLQRSSHRFCCRCCCSCRWAASLSYALIRFGPAAASPPPRVKAATVMHRPQRDGGLGLGCRGGAGAAGELTVGMQGRI